MTLTILAAAASGHLNPVKLFLDADIVVQLVMLGLIAASVWVWTIVVSFSLRMGAVNRANAAYEQGFWQAPDIEAYHGLNNRTDAPASRVAAAGLAEWRRSLAAKKLDAEGARQRLASVMGAVVEQESDRLGERLNFLATVGSAAPFIGLFGTVWGIMNSFFQIGQQQNSSLAVVAPGISEALFATAIGLFAAIPAVIAYNRFSNAVNHFEARLQRFADRFHTTLSRELEAQ
ncbi:MAG TPA: protein TolQ [Novosphingobium sp.]|nr:protein TolQ [Novosphingobium sp.]